MLLKLVNAGGRRGGGRGDARGVRRKVERVAEAARVSLLAIEEARRVAEVGTTERQLHARLKQFVKDAGYRMGFPLLCSAGPNSANIHARAGEYAIREGDNVLIDIGL
ncbi:MAG: M24 family metallopeptidase, partial [Promethearchaeota archaeon]